LRSDSTIRLHPLDFASTATLVRHLLTGADDAVVDTIARHSGGSPLEIATLCDEIARRAPGSPQRPLQHLISDGVAALKPAEREFLQICALLGEPIEYRILFKLYPDAEALGRLMGAAVTPYLLADGPALRFRHASVLEAVRETVDFDLPLRRKIIAALRQLESSEATDYERLVQQASACDDRELVFASHIRFADVAFGRKRWDAVVQASERALAAGEPEAADFVQFFSHYATALRSLERGGEASDVLREALRKAEFAGIKKGHGALIALLMAELWVEENVDEALAVCDRYLNLPMDPSDHAYILATALMICGIALDTPLFEKYDTLFHAVSPFAPNFAQATRGSAYASISSGRGDYDEAKRAMRRAIAVADQRGSRQSDDLPFMELCIDIRQYGCVVAEERLAKLLDQTRFESRDLVYGNLLSSWLSVARGNWFDARLSAEDAIATETTIGMRATAIGTLAMIGALSNDEQALPGDTMIVAERLLHEGYGESALLLFPWLLVRRKHPELEDFLVRHLRNARTQPRIHVIGYTPAALVLAGQNSENPALHDYVMQRETPVDKSPWSLAHWGLARGILLEREKPSAAAALLKAVSRDFTGLGASFFAAYAAMRAGAADSEQQSLLDRLNVTLSTQPTSVRPKKPKDDRFGLTPREWQVARLIADGSTNKEIAESLFLSERTVESHVSNTLAKLQLASRTLLTRWMYQNSAL
jgi:DNA-binding CsgD family transcriptional regulator/tetratricopeptide (TPR) repeat protein